MKPDGPGKVNSKMSLRQFRVLLKSRGMNLMDMPYLKIVLWLFVEKNNTKLGFIFVRNQNTSEYTKTWHSS